MSVDSMMSHNKPSKNWPGEYCDANSVCILSYPEVCIWPCVC
jgi:hypothetical protein